MLVNNRAYAKQIQSKSFVKVWLLVVVFSLIKRTFKPFQFYWLAVEHFRNLCASSNNGVMASSWDLCKNIGRRDVIMKSCHF